MIRWVEKQIGDEIYVSSLCVGAYEFTEVGDILIISPSVPILGLSSGNHTLKGVPIVSNENSFRIDLKYSVDEGISWKTIENWGTLNYNASIEGVRQNHLVLLEFIVTRVQQEGDVPYFIGIDFELMDTPVLQFYPPVPEFYQQHQSDIQVPYYNYTALNWALNVLQKVYRRGIVPAYIKRSNNHNWEDEGYIELWWSIIYPIALRIAIANEFADLLWNLPLLKRFLEQRGLIIGNISGLDELYHLMVYFYDDISRRGTLSVLDIDRTIGNDDRVRGELARLIDLTNPTELFIGLVNSYENGWWVGKSSPCGYVNTDIYENYILGYENKITNIDNYPLINPTSVDYSIVDGEIVVQSTNQQGGIGVSDYETGRDFLIPVNPSRFYLFKIKLYLPSSKTVTFGLNGFDSLGLEGFFGQVTSSVSPTEKNFFENKVLQAGYHTLIGILRPATTTYKAPLDGVSLPLHFSLNTSISSVVPRIEVNGSFSISEFRFCLLRQKNIYIESVLQKECELLIKNNNLNYTNAEVEKIIRKKLFPVGFDYVTEFE